MGHEPELRILFVEDLPEDAEIAMRELRKSGLDFQALRVDTMDEFLAALEGFTPDIIISDYSMPRFDGMKALKLSLERNPELPFIVLTGSKNEETAVLCMRSGASDYIIKGHISRLPFAVQEALEHARAERENKAASRMLEESEQDYRTLANSGQALIWTSGVDRLCTYFNKPWLEFTGRGLEEEYGNGWSAGVHPDDFEHCIGTYVSAFDRRERFSLEYRLRRHDGEYRWIIDDGCPRFGSDGEFLGYIGHCLDITERKRAEERIKNALEEKEILLRELFHRTRNNMQVIIALLAAEEESVHDALVTAVVRKTSDRIMSMSLVHKKLYESQDLSRIDLGDYTKELVGLLTAEEPFTSGRISVNAAVEPVSVLIDTAIPCGLVLHELVSNALRHAYPGDRRGEVRIGLSRTPAGSIEFEVADDGVGLPGGLDQPGKGTIGYQLIRGLVEQQLRGSLRFGTSSGFSCQVSFTDAQVMKRV